MEIKSTAVSFVFGNLQFVGIPFILIHEAVGLINGNKFLLA
jgi:hypothetical protein